MGRWDKGITVQRAINIGRFGRWTVVDKAETNPYVLVLCDCGNTGKVRADSLLNSHTRSCGCLAKELAGNRVRTHGNTYKPLFYLWHDMNRCCYDMRRKDYPLYGGRGVIVCERWNKLNPEGYQNFVDDMGIPEGNKRERLIG